MTSLPDPIPFTVTALFDAYAATRPNEERTYLGASVIGEECERKLWYSFRWAHAPEQIDGRKAYLFDTGHVEEARMITALKAVPGITVVDRGDDGKQLGFNALGGHFRGHMDAKAIGIIEAPSTWHIVECKTHKASSFRATAKHGVAKEHPEHVTQANLYMHYEGITRAFYLFENKDDSWLDSQRFNYDPIAAAQSIAKAERIIQASRPLPKLHENPASKSAFACSWCPARGICHEGKWARVHCRTCLHSTPVDGGWYCERHDQELDIATQRIGCAQHLFIPDLVPGEQVDADESKETVTYRLPDGSTWVDGDAPCSA